MKLEYLHLDGYKGLKDFSVKFREQHKNTVAVDFLIGRNGAGKSTLLEAVGLIFTRIMQGEQPGFGFELKYRILDGIVDVKPAKEDLETESGRKLDIRITVEGKERMYDIIPNKYLPDRIVSYCSGANNSMEEILISSPRDSLASDLYDISHLEEEQRGMRTNEILQYYEELDRNPRVLYLDAVTSKFVLPVLFAILPLELHGQENGKQVERYGRLREMLIKRLAVKMAPAAFSLRVDDEKMEAAGDMPQMNIFRRIVEDVAGGKENFHGFKVNSQSAGRVDSDGVPAMETVVTFCYEAYRQGGKEVFYQPELQNFFEGNPFVLLSVLLSAYRAGVITDIAFVYADGKKKGLFGAESLSDGEFMWLARMGLILMAQSYCGGNTLFLFDEPDVHFNDDWNRNFVDLIYQMNRDTENEFLVATHSTLLLTDAMFEQVTLMERGGNNIIQVKDIDMSTFAAQRDEISKRIFGAGAIGTYAADTVQRMMEETDLDEMRKYIDSLGPGYQKFRLAEQFYDLLDKE